MYFYKLLLFILLKIISLVLDLQTSSLFYTELWRFQLFCCAFWWVGCGVVKLSDTEPFKISCFLGFKFLSC